MILTSSYYPHSLNVLSSFLLSLENKRREEGKIKERKEGVEGESLGEGGEGNRGNKKEREGGRERGRVKGQGGRRTVFKTTQ